MPSVPKWFGDALEKVSSKYYHLVRITQVDHLNESLKKVRFEGDLGSLSFTAGQVIEFRVTDRDYRHYTPCLFDPAQNVCEVIFYLHGNGVGSAWASALKEGQELKLIGPGGKLAYREAFSTHFVFGDETSIGLLRCMGSECGKRGHRLIGLLELAPEHIRWQVGQDSDTMIVRASMESPAKRAMEMLKLRKHQYAVDNACFYLTGRAKSIQRLRDYLIKSGIPRKQILTDPYWAEGKKGL